MQSVVFVIALTLSAQFGATKPFIDNNPDLEEYQNMEDCFSKKATIYMMFRNYEEDRYFGGTSKCVSATIKRTGIERSVPFTVDYGTTKS
ncbi:hypothetical protein MTO96_036752 [Rhipicephalus appendiculatus]